MPARVLLVAGSRAPARMRPPAAVLGRGQLPAVSPAGGRGASTLRQIRLGRRLPGDAIEVLSGLKGDEILALDPVQAGIQARSAAAAR